MTSDILFWVLVISCVYIISKAFRNIDELYQFPVILTLATLIFIIPTLYFIKGEHLILPEEYYNRYVFNSILCFWLGIIGYKFGFKYYKSKVNKEYYYNYNKALKVLAIYTVVGGIASTQIDANEFGNQLGGIFAIILYFSRLLRPAAIILLSLYLTKPKKITLILFLVWLFFSLKFLIISGRRSEFFTIILVIGVPLFIFKKITLPKQLLLPGIILGILVVIVLPLIRPYTKNGEYTKVLDLNYQTLMHEYIIGSSSNEIVHSSLNMAAVAKTNSFNYGTSAINGLIFLYASSTIFGKDFKQSLLLEEIDLQESRNKLGYINDYQGFLYYLSPTGYGNAYIEFGYAGSVMFLILGYVSAVFYKRAIYFAKLNNMVFYSLFVLFILVAVYESILSIAYHLTPYLLVYYHVFLSAKGRQKN